MYQWLPYGKKQQELLYHIQQFPNIGLDNSLVPTRRQAIIWTSDV